MFEWIQWVPIWIHKHLQKLNSAMKVFFGHVDAFEINMVLLRKFVLFIDYSKWVCVSDADGAEI